MQEGLDEGWEPTAPASRNSVCSVLLGMTFPYPHPAATHFASPRCTSSRPVVSTPRLSCIVYCIHEFPLFCFCSLVFSILFGFGGSVAAIRCSATPCRLFAKRIGSSSRPLAWNCCATKNAIFGNIWFNKQYERWQEQQQQQWSEGWKWGS